MASCRGAWPWLPLLLQARGAAALFHGLANASQSPSGRDPYSPYNSGSLVRAVACNRSSVDATAARLAAAGCQLISDPGELVLPLSGRCAEGLAVCPPAGAAALAAAGAELLVSGMAGRFLRESGAGTIQPWARRALDLQLGGDRDFYAAFRSYEDILERVRSTVALSGGVAELGTLRGKTYQGRVVHTVTLRGADWVPGLPRGVFTFTLHAREWIAAMAGAYAVEQIIREAQKNPDLFRNMSVTIVPICNPDGFVYSSTHARFWRKNRRPRGSESCSGVDLNRNFDFHWQPQQGRSDSCSDVYPGPSAASEPETIMLQQLVLEAPVSVAIDFHSAGGFVLGPWSYTTVDHPRKREIDELGTQLKSAIAHTHGLEYEFCTGNKCLYPVAGSLPDFSTSKSGLAFTIEMRPRVLGITLQKHFDPPATEIIPNAEENFNALMAALAHARPR